MRTTLLILALLQTLSAEGALAQEAGSSTRSRVAQLVPILIPSAPAFQEQVDYSDLPQLDAVQRDRDRRRGALWGLAAGALIGGIGFTTVTWVANRGSTGEDYWPLALMVGSAAGGAVGFVAGAFIGAPERQDGTAARTTLLVIPDEDYVTRLGISVAF